MLVNININIENKFTFLQYSEKMHDHIASIVRKGNPISAVANIMQLVDVQLLEISKQQTVIFDQTFELGALQYVFVCLFFLKLNNLYILIYLISMSCQFLFILLIYFFLENLYHSNHLYQN